MFFCGMAVQATVLETKFDRHLAKEADLIFQGVVSNIEYKLSTGDGKTTETLPHTFVTFEIEHLYKGDVTTGSTLTLRFEGGIDDEGRIMVVDGVPLFDVGDRDVLFVKGNGTSPCPLVGWNQGRFRLIEGQVYSDAGCELLSTDQLEIGYLFVKSDILNPATFLSLLRDEKGAVDQRIKANLGKDTLNGLRADYAADPALRNMLLKLVLRDLNRLLARNDLFTDEMINSLPLREDSRDGWKSLHNSTNIPAVMRMNRRVLEDVYPTLIVKTPDRIMIGTRYHALEPVLTHTYRDNIASRFKDSTEGKGGSDAPAIPGNLVTFGELEKSLPLLIQKVTTPDELKASPRVTSADIGKDFTVPVFTKTAPPSEYNDLFNQ